MSHSPSGPPGPPSRGHPLPALSHARANSRGLREATLWSGWSSGGSRKKETHHPPKEPYKAPTMCQRYTRLCGLRVRRMFAEPLRAETTREDRSEIQAKGPPTSPSCSHPHSPPGPRFYSPPFLPPGGPDCTFQAPPAASAWAWAAGEESVRGKGGWRLLPASSLSD